MDAFCIPQGRHRMRKTRIELTPVTEGGRPREERWRCWPSQTQHGSRAAARSRRVVWTERPTRTKHACEIVMMFFTPHVQERICGNWAPRLVPCLRACTLYVTLASRRRVAACWQTRRVQQPPCRWDACWPCGLGVPDKVQLYAMDSVPSDIAFLPWSTAKACFLHRRLSKRGA